MTCSSHCGKKETRRAEGASKRQEREKGVGCDYASMRHHTVPSPIPDDSSSSWVCVDPWRRRRCLHCPKTRARSRVGIRPFPRVSAMCASSNRWSGSFRKWLTRIRKSGWMHGCVRARGELKCWNPECSAVIGQYGLTSSHMYASGRCVTCSCKCGYCQHSFFCIDKECIV